MNEKEFKLKLNAFLALLKAVGLELETFMPYLNDENDWFQYGYLRKALENFIEDTENNPEAYYIIPEGEG